MVLPIIIGLAVMMIGKTTFLIHFIIFEFIYCHLGLSI